MGDLTWQKRGYFGMPEKAMRMHIVALGTSGSGKTETLYRLAYGARKVYNMQVIFLDAKGETKPEEEQAEDNAARFVAAMRLAGADKVLLFPHTHYHGWQGTPTELKNRLLSVIDYRESAYYGDVAANALDLALFAPNTPRSSQHFLANLRLDRLKDGYKDDPIQFKRVLALDKKLLQAVEMRYQVFFAAMHGQLDGTLDYRDADAVYLRIRGFALRNEAPPLGRFLVSDFMHYIESRRRPGVRTLFIIDEFNALRMREETALLFEQVRSFGGQLVISSQGYAGLGPPEYAKRILDACSTYVLHACSDPFEVCKRAGKRFYLDVSWSEDEEGIPRKHIRPRYDWRIPETAVMQQKVGQAFWSHRARSQQVQTAQVPVTDEQVREAWHEIRLQQEAQQAILAAQEEARKAKQQSSENTGEKQRSSSTRQAGSTTKPRQPARSTKPAPKTRKLPEPPATPGTPDDGPDIL